MAKITTIIDIGSNSVRMAIFKKTSQFGFYLLYEIKAKVRISQGTYEHKGVLQKAPLKRALRALSDFKDIAEKYKSRKILCVATSAVRDAPNSKEFVALVKEECGLQVKVIDGKKEAFYGGVACANLLHHKDGITIDIGGGSTECALIENGKIKDLISVNLGTIRLKELFFDKNLDLSLAREFIQKELAKLPPHFKTSCVFGVGGTIRSLAKVGMFQNNYPIDVIHGYEMDVKSNWHWMQQIIRSSESQLAEFGISEDRKDSIRSGTLIFTMFLEHFKASTIVASGVGVREGVFLSDMLRSHNHSFPKGINPSILSLLDRFLPHSKHSQEVKKECAKLFEVLQPLHGIHQKYLYHLKIAGQLSSIGKVLNFYNAHKHGAYLSLHSLSYGFSHQDRAIICLLVQFSHKKIPRDSNIAHISAIMPPILTLQWLSFILGLAETMCLARVPKGTHYSLKHKTLQIKCPSDTYLCQEIAAKLTKPVPFEIEFV
ncbi:Guanosine pentaphosphate phosphohydrolase GppA [Helicobacter sp. NHP19-012]|uniref:Guanosine pentaphosphate phosphohydrolase GppA n=1 Tax=Helicobacter gastrofelis TaxID=2849642 RepID=A0ABN6I894_9HELI|nr:MULTISPECIES: Ppx/GppA phosphatase family protein [unclassified Helicobacter]BCZ19237.1 Guanosine pentaphosphate phosphohydrolase GppA [Helicobacter sp. NHP19-012]GMB96015.1 Guanosine pentaphosphate phosphohydrolase GppA [Helicobacter sp. NHP22-001]